ncbi:hypothetical protein CEXT_732711 [Caerostris extrusa]|uniref:Uncharacterized protein n=1 Tax=Caerostris extrusa TaxID=172846 RepID=A0AAV4R1I3_CAEEX|nr:hypothetical protein CEXT_732711 [Caerostris extrusa]
MFVPVCDFRNVVTRRSEVFFYTSPKLREVTSKSRQGKQWPPIIAHRWAVKNGTRSTGAISDKGTGNLHELGDIMRQDQHKQVLRNSRTTSPEKKKKESVRKGDNPSTKRQLIREVGDSWERIDWMGEKSRLIEKLSQAVTYSEDSRQVPWMKQ